MDIAWSEIAAQFDHRQLVSGGFSIAERGVVTLSDGRRVFVKMSDDDWTKTAINREVDVYTWLNAINFPYAPRMLSWKDGGLAIEDLSQLDFSHNWNDKKLAACLVAMDTLTTLRPSEFLANREKTANGWREIAMNPDILEVLKKRSDSIVLQQLKLLDVIAFADSVEDLVEQNSALVHMDVRGDNLAYDARHDCVYLVDWNWLGYMNRDIDRISLLTSVKRSGLDVERYYRHFLDKKAALFMAGFWLAAASRPIWEGGDPGLRDIQLESALICLRWAEI